ncbi:hypothetical protein B0H13DRAFT_2345069 [Mycena leptocephala]|nr:hypothetical protein B0H13DRAFT_2345069 [Mycena leptocephala]
MEETTEKLRSFFTDASTKLDTKTKVKKSCTEHGLKDKFQMIFLDMLFDSYKKTRGAATKRAALDAVVAALPEDTTSPIWQIKVRVRVRPCTDTAPRFLPPSLRRYFFKLNAGNWRRAEAPCMRGSDELEDSRELEDSEGVRWLEAVGGVGKGIIDLKEVIHLTNIARGYHASDFSIMNKPVTLAKQHGVLLSSAHTSRTQTAKVWAPRDRHGACDELLSCLVYQIGALAGFLELHEPCETACKHRQFLGGWRSGSRFITHRVRSTDKPRRSHPLRAPSSSSRVHWFGGTAHQAACEEAGVRFIPVLGLSTRNRVVRRLDYDADWRLLITKTHKPVSKDVATLLEDHKLTTNLGGILPVGDSVTEISICCHSNTHARRIPHLHLRHYRREKAN